MKKRKKKIQRSDLFILLGCFLKTNIYVVPKMGQPGAEAIQSQMQEMDFYKTFIKVFQQKGPSL